MSEKLVIKYLSPSTGQYEFATVQDVGDLEKPKLRELAQQMGVRVYSKKDSQEICFVDDGKLKQFLIENTKGKAEKPGNIVDKNGNILGKHKGFSFLNYSV